MEIKLKKLNLSKFYPNDFLQILTKKLFTILVPLGVIFILNANFPLLYVVKMSLRRRVGGSKKPQNILT